MKKQIAPMRHTCNKIFVKSKWGTLKHAINLDPRHFNFFIPPIYLFIF